MKKHSGGVWFSMKRKIASRSALARDVGKTLLRRTEIAERLRDSALTECPTSQKVLQTLTERNP